MRVTLKGGAEPDEPVDETGYHEKKLKVRGSVELVPQIPEQVLMKSSLLN